MKTICLTLTLAEGSPTAELISQRRSPQAVSAVPSAICCLPQQGCQPPSPAAGLWPPPHHSLSQWFGVQWSESSSHSTFAMGRVTFLPRTFARMGQHQQQSLLCFLLFRVVSQLWVHFGMSEPAPSVFPSTSSALSRPEREKPPPEGDTYLTNCPKSSQRVSQPGHLHSPWP